jgi:hypothetical protein
MWRVRRGSIIVMALLAASCQSPTDPDNSTNYTDILDVTPTPNPIIADTLTGGRTYRVVRGNNQPDDILAYDWHAIFSLTLTFNDNAKDKDLNVDFPVKVSATTITVKQASGGIVTPPTGADTEKSEFVILNTSSNQLSAIGNPMTGTFEVWYDLPNLRKEAVVQVTFSFTDNDGTTFSILKEITVAP